LARHYVLATVFRISPTEADDMAAADIDELLVLHGQMCKFAQEHKGG